MRPALYRKPRSDFALTPSAAVWPVRWPPHFAADFGPVPQPRPPLLLHRHRRQQFRQQLPPGRHHASPPPALFPLPLLKAATPYSAGPLTDQIRFAEWPTNSRQLRHFSAVLATDLWRDKHIAAPLRRRKMRRRVKVTNGLVDAFLQLPEKKRGCRYCPKQLSEGQALTSYKSSKCAHIDGGAIPGEG